MIKWGFIEKTPSTVLKVTENSTTYTTTQDLTFLYRLFSSQRYFIVFLIATFYALVGDDLRHLMASPPLDPIFYTIMTLTCLFFAFDIIASSLYSPSYSSSVLLPLDITSVIFLLFDIGPINEFFFKSMSLNVYGVLARGARFVFFGYALYQKYKVFFGVFKRGVGKEARLEIKESVILQDQKKRKRRLTYTLEIEDFETNQNLETQQDLDCIEKTQIPKKVTESVVNTGQKLTRSFQTKLMVWTLLLIYLLPIFWTATYYSDLSSQRIGVFHLTNYAQKFGLDNNFQLLWDQYINLQQKDKYLTFIKLELFKSSQVLKQEGNLKSLDSLKNEFRYYELKIFESQEIQQGIFIRAIWQTRNKADLDSWLSILRTLFFLFALITAGILLSRDIQQKFTDPFFELMTKVKLIHDNPMDAWHTLKQDENSPNSNSEIRLLAKRLVKASQLLSIGLGEAGNKLVVQQLKFKNQDSLKDTLRASKVFCFFGFIYLNKFSTFTEELRDGIFDFVNSIAEIVHQTVFKYGGKVNKNIGEAFLIAWKIKPENLELKFNVKMKKSEWKVREDRRSTQALRLQAEMAVLSFIEIAVQSSRDQLFNKSNLQKQHKLSLGLHYGWAIEGAIGSSYKIDVSYLSPNVNLASRVTAAALHYSLPLLISGTVVNFTSQIFQNQLRQVDRVFLKGSKTDITLFSFDLDFSVDLSRFPKIFDFRNRDYQTLKKQSSEREQRFQDIFEQLELGELQPMMLLKSEEIRALRLNYEKSDFFLIWKKGFQYYQNGSWLEAAVEFEECQRIIPSDGPAQNLLTFMDKNNFKAPADWKGIRSLLKK